MGLDLIFASDAPRALVSFFAELAVPVAPSA
jgi:hypothetical protein